MVVSFRSPYNRLTLVRVFYLRFTRIIAGLPFPVCASIGELIFVPFFKQINDF